MEGGRGSGKSVIQCRRKISLTLSCLSVIVFSVHCDVNSLSPYAPPMMLCLIVGPEATESAGCGLKSLKP